MSENLDLKAAKTSQEILKNSSASEVENIVTKALGVLQEDGVYAVILYLLSKKKDITKKLIEQTKIFNPDKCEEIDKIISNYKSIEICKYVSDNICNNLDKLFIVKEVWERTLIYTRYGAKALKTEDNK